MAPAMSGELAGSRLRAPAPRARRSADADELFPTRDNPPVLVADEPDQARPDDWLIHAYFEREPNAEELAAAGRSSAPAALRSRAARRGRLGDDEPGGPAADPRRPLLRPHADLSDARRRAPSRSRSTPASPSAPASTRRPPAASKRSTGSRREERRFANIADIGTGTGLLAFAALALWPDAKCIATDIDPVAIDVARDNAAINRVTLGHGAGELLLASPTAWIRRCSRPARRST